LGPTAAGVHRSIVGGALDPSVGRWSAADRGRILVGMSRHSAAFAAIYTLTVLATGCGGRDPGGGASGPGDASADSDGGHAQPRLAAAWLAQYRFPLPEAGGPRIELPALLQTWVGEAGPPGLAEALDFWLRSAAPPEVARFIAAWNALDDAELEIEIEAAAALDPVTLWALDDWRHARVRAACPGGDVAFELSPGALADLGLGPDGWGPYPLEVWTASAAVRVSATRTGAIDGRSLRALRSRAAIACATGGEARDLGGFLRDAVPCDEVVEPLGRLGAVARGVCAEGLRRVADWLEGGVVDRHEVSLEMTGVGFGHPPLRFRGTGGAGLAVRYDGGMVDGTWSWTREPG
jgi:hypothetical protein